MRLVGPFTSMRSLEAAVCAHRQWDGLVCDQGGRICRVQASSLTEPHTLFLWKHQLLFRDVKLSTSAYHAYVIRWWGSGQVKEWSRWVGWEVMVKLLFERDLSRGSEKNIIVVVQYSLSRQVALPQPAGDEAIGKGWEISHIHTRVETFHNNRSNLNGVRPRNLVCREP